MTATIKKETFNEINIFKILGMESGAENRHSNFLAWLMNANNNHGLKAKFLDEFLKSLGYKFDLENITVEREVKTNSGRPDIVIKDKNKNVICIIEVKFGAKETKEQCKRYYDEYKYNHFNRPVIIYLDLNSNSGKKLENPIFIYLDLNSDCYEELKNKEGYRKDDGFDFAKVYKLATFKENILPVLEKVLPETKDETRKLIEQYTNLLKEKYYILNENEIKSCVDVTNNKSALEKYALEAGNPIHSFIWYTVPNRYNDAIYKIIKENFEILHKWKENGSSLSLRFAKNKCDFHDDEHYYIDHRNNKIVLNFQKNLNQSEKECKIIISEEDYFKNMLMSDNDFYKNLCEKLLNAINN